MVKAVMQIKIYFMEDKMMKLTEKQIADLKVMALENVKNADIAVALGISLEEVHAARSQLGITIDKTAEITTQPCGCCGSAAPADEEHTYIMPDDDTEVCLCDRCALTVDFINSFVEDDDDFEDHTEFIKTFGEEHDDSEDENEIQDS